MEQFWNIAIGIGGISAIGSFVFWSLYKQWLKLGIFAQLTKDQTFRLMIIFLVLTFTAFLSILFIHIITNNNSEQKSFIPYDVIINGEIKNTANFPIKNALITIDGYDFESTSKNDGKFFAVMKIMSSNEVVTLRVVHKDYNSYSIDRLIESDNERFQIILKKRLN